MLYQNKQHAPVSFTWEKSPSTRKWTPLKAGMPVSALKRVKTLNASPCSMSVKITWRAASVWMRLCREIVEVRRKFSAICTVCPDLGLAAASTSRCLIICRTKPATSPNSLGFCQSKSTSARRKVQFSAALPEMKVILWPARSGKVGF